MSIPFEVVIIGGGVYGASVAFHLARLGQTNVALLDKGPIGGETSSQGAGFLASLRETDALTRLGLYSMQFYANFEKETNSPLDVHPVGSVKVVSTSSSEELLHQEQRVARDLNVDVRPLTTTELARLVPTLDTTQVRAAHYIPFEGYVEQTAPVAYGFARGAHRLGVKVFSHATIQHIRPNDNGRFTLVLENNELEASQLVIAAGAHSPALAAQLGVSLPVYPILHQCSVVSTQQALPANMPAIRLPDIHQYVRFAAGGLLVGGTEDELTSPEPQAPASDLELKQLKPSHAILSGFLERAATWFPAIRDSFTIREQRGLITISPDLNFVAGQAPDLPGLYFASGCNGRGVQSAPGVGRLVAELMTLGSSWINPAAFRLDRFGNQFDSPEALRQACLRSLSSGVATEPT